MKRLTLIRLMTKLNHIQWFLICLLWFPVFIFLVWLFADSIDQYFARWQTQFIFAMTLFLAIGLTWAFRKILGKD